MSDPVIWWITTGQAGFRSQARGLVDALGWPAEEKTIDLGALWSLLPPAFSGQVLGHLRPRLEPPWPDLIVSCSRKAARAAIAIKRASGGQALAVHIQDPLAPLGEFDLVIPMRHDGIDGPNVLPVDTALNDVSPAKLSAAAEAWRSRLAHLPRPLTGALLGGSTRRASFEKIHAVRLIEGLKLLRAHGGLAVTPSRRTPPEAKTLLAEAFAGDPGVFMWDEQGDNPYFGILALANRLVVTSDSVSMVSEALASGGPVSVFEIGGGGARHRRFLKNLLDRRMVGLLGGPMPVVPDSPANVTPLAAQTVRALLYARTGVVG